MDPSISADHLWNALVEGGAGSQKAVASFTALPERQKEAAFEQLLRRTEGYISTLIAEETAGNRKWIHLSAPNVKRRCALSPSSKTSTQSRTS